MRLEGQSKLGYYPTPAQTLQYILTHLSWPAGAQLIRTLDPCCGQGEAIAAITNGYGTAYGIELSDARAQAAEDALPHVLNTAYEYAMLTPGTFSLVLLNPPYDGEGATGGGKRMEETFLCDLPTTDVLVPNGVLVYLIPHARINERIARHLAGWYTNLQCFLLPEGEYEVFKQCVIFAQRKPDYSTPDRAEVQSVLAWKDAQVILDWRMVETTDPDTGKAKKVRQPVLGHLTPLSIGSAQYAVPALPEKGKGQRPFKFQYTAVTEEDFAREAEECAQRLDGQRMWTDLIPPLEPPTLRPAMTPKKGHIAMQVTGGLLGTNRITEKGGAPVLLKGHIETYWVSRESETEVDPDKESMRKIEMEQRFRAALATLNTEGDYQSTNEPTAIADLLEKYVAQLTEIVQGRNVPLYDMKPEPWEWAVFDSLSKGRALSGRAETGLTDFQKHLAIALGRLCREYGAGFINAEMGSGKSGIGIALAEYLRVSDERKGRKQTVYPALVVGPGIVTGKENWPKEIPDVTPGADSRVITVGAKPLPKAAKVGTYVRDTLNLSINDFDFFGTSALSVLIRIVHAAEVQDVMLGKDVVHALLASLKHAEKHPPTKRKGADKPNLLDGRIGGYEWLGLQPPRDESSEDDLRGKYSLAQFVQEHRTGQLPEKCYAVISYETAKLGSGRVPAMTTRNVQVVERDEDDEISTRIETVLACPICGAPVAYSYDPEIGKPQGMMTPGQAEQFIGLKRRFCQSPKPRRVWNADKNEHEIHKKDTLGVPYVCGAPLFENSALRRMPAADYARKQAKNVFGLCLVDEIHQAKSKGTGVGFALTSLTNAARYVVGLTGTLLNGYSTSIFWLWYRLAGEVRNEFRFNDEQRWTEKYGLLKRTFYTDNDGLPNDDGAFTGTKFHETVSERPGISPAIAGIALKYATFSSLKDVGLPLPAYSEEVVRLPMTNAMAAQYAQADGSTNKEMPTGLYKWATSRMKDDDGKGAISVWLNTALNRPDAMFRSEIATFNYRISGRGKWAKRGTEIPTTFPAVTQDWLPKEKWAAEQCLAELRAGRKTLVYVRQTGERDIQPRLQECLQEHGLRVGILKPSLAPPKRASWIKQHAHEWDVLLSNARLVQVGLNLTTFSTAIFYELEWSLAVIWQAMRRLYRPGAPKPVKVFFPVYEGALEEKALNLIGAKMLAAMTFYGDEATGALVEESDGSLLDDLRKMVMGEMKELNVGRAEGLFAGVAHGGPLTSDLSLGNPVVPSPALVYPALEMLVAQVLVARRKKAIQTEGQLTLF